MGDFGTGAEVPWRALSLSAQGRFHAKSKRWMPDQVRHDGLFDPIEFGSSRIAISRAIRGEVSTFAICGYLQAGPIIARPRSASASAAP
jgi:hypothetical protein